MNTPKPDRRHLFQAVWINATLFCASILVCGLAIEIVLRLTTSPPQIISLEKKRSAIAPRPSDKVKVLALSQSVEPALRQTPGRGLRFYPNKKVFIKNHHLSHRDVILDINSLGFRSPELGPKKPEDLRVLVLGDSITVADYLPATLTYPALLESYFKQNPLRGWEHTNIQFINAGVGSTDLSSYFALLQESGLEALPDIVLVGLYLNDANHAVYINMRSAPEWVQKSYLLSLVYKIAKLWKISNTTGPDSLVQILDKAAKQLFTDAHRLQTPTPLNFRRLPPEASFCVFVRYCVAVFT